MIVNSIYLDQQASAPLADGVFEAMKPYFTDAYANPHSSEHAAGWRSSEAAESARAAIARAVGADPDELVFTSGATEANNIVLLGVDRLSERPRLITTAIEHKSVLAPIRARAELGAETVIVPVDADGVVRLDAMRAALDGGATLVSVMAVSNEIGTRQPLVEIAMLCRAAGALLHVDAAQALAYGAIDMLEDGADMVSLSSHKAGGPKGIGALVISRDARARLSPIMFGGGQEDGLRPGTLPTPLCVGFGAACSAIPDAAGVAAWRARGDALARKLIDLVPGAVRNGGGPGRHPGNVSITLPQGEASAVIARLQPGLAVSSGSACTSGIAEPSHVLRAIGLGAGAADRTIRLSLGPATTDAEVEQAAQLLARAAMRSN